MHTSGITYTNIRFRSRDCGIEQNLTIQSIRSEDRRGYILADELYVCGKKNTNYCVHLILEGIKHQLKDRNSSKQNAKDVYLKNVRANSALR